MANELVQKLLGLLGEPPVGLAAPQAFHAAGGTLLGQPMGPRGVEGPAAQAATTSLGGLLGAGLEFAPGSGDYLAFQDFQKANQVGDRTGATLAAASLIPGVGEVAGAAKGLMGAKGALSMAGGLLGQTVLRKADELPMDEVSRMARADEMFPVEAYTGANRLDRLLEKPGLDKKRATSGPMPFFTDNTEIASNYAAGKADTSRLNDSDFTYSDWFKLKPPGARKPQPLDRAWAYFDAAERRRITEQLGQIGYIDDEFEAIGKTTSNVGGAGRDHWEWTLKQHNGNALAAARDLWLDSGQLFNDEERFLDVLRQAGVDAAFDSPRLSVPGVLPARLAIHKPFETTPENLAAILPDIKEAAKRKRGKDGGGVDMWHKDHVSGPQFVQRLEDDIANGTTHAWTSIPDWVTEVLKSRGFDGIKDMGGKHGGVGHTVWIPFEPNQVRSRFAKFDPKMKDSANLLAGVGGIGLLGAWGIPPEPSNE